MSPSKFVSVDWGTSRLRITLADITTNETTKIVDKNLGVKPTFNEWQSQRIKSQKDFFLDILIRNIPTEYDKYPIVVSGMASSSIGIENLDYAELPFETDGKTLSYKKLRWMDWSGPIYLISGIKSQNDVMRGEEIQMIGIRQKYRTHDILVLPGTHSKHLYFREKMMYDFKTFLTGELFAIIKDHSILKNSVIDPENNDIKNTEFEKGVLDSRDNLLHTLFTIRGRGLLQDIDGRDNYHYLSGLLIGTELRSLPTGDNYGILIAANKTFSALYQSAADVLQISTTTLSYLDLENATISGQKLFLKNVTT